MRALTLALALLNVALQAQPIMVAQEHTLPPGHYCTPPKTDLPARAHACDCQRECIDGEDGTMQVHEDPQCKTYCTPTSCRCPMKNCP